MGTLKIASNFQTPMEERSNHRPLDEDDHIQWYMTPIEGNPDCSCSGVVGIGLISYEGSNDDVTDDGILELTIQEVNDPDKPDDYYYQRILVNKNKNGDKVHFQLDNVDDTSSDKYLGMGTSMSCFHTDKSIDTAWPDVVYFSFLSGY